MTQAIQTHEHLLGTDGFRGEYNSGTEPGTMNPTTVAGLSYALVQSQIREGASSLVVIGRDTRPCNTILEQAAISGALLGGADVIAMGVAPTPAILKTAQSEGALAAIALTASHNPARYGGWKGTFGPDKPRGEQISALEDHYWTTVASGLKIPITKEVKRDGQYIENYIEGVVSDIRSNFMTEYPIKDRIFVVDTAYGAANEVTPVILERLGANVVRFAGDTSHPINAEAGATNLFGVQEFLRQRPNLVADPRFMGVLLNDGDADRMLGMGATITPSGSMHFDTLDGNRVLELLAQNETGVVGTEYTNDASVERITRKGTKFEFCPNGDTNVTIALQSHMDRGENWRVGSEFSGHHVDLRWLSSGDGVRMAAWVAAYSTLLNTPIPELCRSLPLYPEKMRTIKLAPAIGKLIMNDTAVMEATNPTRTDVEHAYRGVYRQSGTEPKFRIWGVGSTESYVENRLEHIAEAVLSASTRYVRTHKLATSALIQPLQ